MCTAHFEMAMMADLGLECGALETHHDVMMACAKYLLWSMQKANPNATIEDALNKLESDSESLKQSGLVAPPMWCYRAGNEQKFFVDVFVMPGLADLPPVVRRQVLEAMEMGQRKHVIYDRNAAWLKIILAFHHKERPLIAVGGAHLYGSKGVVELL